MLEARKVSVSLGRKQILTGIDFSAKPGEVTAIVGPNGSGKSTLMRCLIGDISYTGTVCLNDQDIVGQPLWALAQQRAVLPQANALSFPFTAIEVVQIGLRGGISGDQQAIPTQALARVGLDHYADRFYQELSGGEQQRVQLARVLAQVWNPLEDNTPRWLLLDEPVSALDIAHQLQIMEIARDFAAQGGGVVAIMHDLNLTAMFASKVYILQSGQVLAAGSASEVMQDATLSRAYGCSLRVSHTPAPNIPFVLPQVAVGA